MRYFTNLHYGLLKNTVSYIMCMLLNNVNGDRVGKLIILRVK